jgi:hypothetical protein
MWKIDPKDKCTDKTKHDHIHIYIENTFIIAELPYETWGEEKKKRMTDRVNDIEIHCICVG